MQSLTPAVIQQLINAVPGTPTRLRDIPYGSTYLEIRVQTQGSYTPLPEVFYSVLPTNTYLPETPGVAVGRTNTAWGPGNTSVSYMRTPHGWVDSSTGDKVTSQQVLDHINVPGSGLHILGQPEPRARRPKPLIFMDEKRGP